MPVRYVGFEIPNRFVIGYGLDFAERYRNLPYVAVLHADLIPPRLVALDARNRTAPQSGRNGRIRPWVPKNDSATLRRLT